MSGRIGSAHNVMSVLSALGDHLPTVLALDVSDIRINTSTHHLLATSHPPRSFLWGIGRLFESGCWQQLAVALWPVLTNKAR